MNHDKILITLGDPNGIGSEITEKSLLQIPLEYRKYIEVIGIKASWESYAFKYPDIVFYDIGQITKIQPGLVSSEAGLVAIKTIDFAIDLLNKKKYKGLVTAPISKESVVLSGHEGFTGHTHYLGQQYHVFAEMVFWSPAWSVILATTHIPLSEVSKYLSLDRIRQVIHSALLFNIKYYGETPVAICGLNPHAGENGNIGSEEINILNPLISEFQDKGYVIEGPISPDVIFRCVAQGKYKTVVSLYHDQALIPFKLLHFYDGVNVTVGLPFLRTSPIHGTAFDIAGKGLADCSGMLNAIKFLLLNT